MSSMVRWFCASVLSTALVCPLRAAVPGVAPALQTVVKAANAGKPADAAKYGVPSRTGVFGWIPDEEGLTIRGFFQPDPWKAAVLEPPYTNGGPVAVFHTWHAPESDGDHIHPLVKTPAGWRMRPEISERDTQGYRITHHNLTIRIAPARRSAEMVDTFTVAPYGKPQPVVYVRLSDDFTVKSLTRAGRPVPFKQAGGIIAVRLPKAGPAALTMTYGGAVTHKSLSAVTPGLAVLSAYYYPTLGRLPSTADVSITVPKGWSAVTQGELVSSKTSAGQTTFRFSNTMPVNYFTVDAGPYRITRRKVAGHTVYTYLLKSQPGFAETLIDSVEKALPYFESRFGSYPYSRYTIVDGGSIMGFVALEGYSMATYGTLTLMPNVLAHEVAHTWWGGVVPNTYLRSWWNESFARYSDDAFSRRRNAVAQRHPTDRPWWPSAASVEAAPLSTARDSVSINSIAYEKGRVVLDLLEDQLGQPRFDNVLKEFVRTGHSMLDPDWPDFQRVAERVSGQTLEWFFSQWVRRSGWPTLRLQNVKAEKTPEGQWRLRGEIAQDGEPYLLDLPLRLYGVAADTVPPGTQDRPAWQDASVSITTSPMPFEFTQPFLPEKLAIDPEFTVPRTFGLDDVAVISPTDPAVLSHSREEPSPSPFGGM